MRTSLATVLCLSISVALAQTGGSITGEVKDQTGAVAPNAAVTVTNSQTNVARSTTTNSAGIYSFPDLTPGIYQVKVAAPGFETIVKMWSWVTRLQAGALRMSRGRRRSVPSPRREQACARFNSHSSITSDYFERKSCNYSSKECLPITSTAM
jgi:hypothetical protein